MREELRRGPVNQVTFDLPHGIFWKLPVAWILAQLPAT